MDNPPDTRNNTRLATGSVVIVCKNFQTEKARKKIDGRNVLRDYINIGYYEVGRPTYI